MGQKSTRNVAGRQLKPMKVQEEGQGGCSRPRPVLCRAWDQGRCGTCKVQLNVPSGWVSGIRQKMRPKNKTAARAGRVFASLQRSLDSIPRSVRHDGSGGRLNRCVAWSDLRAEGSLRP